MLIYQSSFKLTCRKFEPCIKAATEAHKWTGDDSFKLICHNYNDVCNLVSKICFTRWLQKQTFIRHDNHFVGFYVQKIVTLFKLDKYTAINVI